MSKAVSNQAIRKWRKQGKNDRRKKEKERWVIGARERLRQSRIPTQVKLWHMIVIPAHSQEHQSLDSSLNYIMKYTQKEREGEGEKGCEGDTLSHLIRFNVSIVVSTRPAPSQWKAVLWSNSYLLVLLKFGAV